MSMCLCHMPPSSTLVNCYSPSRRVNSGVLDVMEKLISRSSPEEASLKPPKEGPPLSTSAPSPDIRRLQDLAVSLGLPEDPGLPPHFSQYSWASTPHLRLSHEGRQLLVSSGPPLRFEMARQREKWETAKEHRQDLSSIKVRD